MALHTQGHSIFYTRVNSPSEKTQLLSLSALPVWTGSFGASSELLCWLLVLRHPRSLGRELRGNWSQLKCKHSLKYLLPHLNLNPAAVTVQGEITE